MANAKLPRGFFGVVPQGPLRVSDFNRMRGVIGSIRISFGWDQIEPQPGKYDFTASDEVVGLAASRGIRVLPFVASSPLWLTGDHERPPQGTARGRRAWRMFLRHLVNRYGPEGSFWRGRADRMPIRRWQIWNEPNFLLAWHPRISPQGYGRLLDIASRAIRGVDRGAQIVAAAVAPVEAGMLPWNFIRDLYRVRGVKRDFDVMALNPYSPTIAGVGYEIRRIRRAMAVAGDAGTPVLITELGVASNGVFPNPFDKGRYGQSRFLRHVYDRLIANRRRWRIAGVDWFAWQDLGYTDSNCVFCQYAGLFDIEGRPKPSWHALRIVAGTGASDVR
ncbi:MAG TPA: beta-galactosidase [Solirubrobacterales bacterium]|nr:beta-galactosidase [Solirubrobacterales bacterium]